MTGVALIGGANVGSGGATLNPFTNVADQPEWKTRTACDGLDVPTGRVSDDGMDTETVFHPIQGGSTRQAKAICAGCPVRAECLEEALDMPTTEDHGVRGGTVPRERIALRVARGARCPDCGEPTRYANTRPVLCDGCRQAHRDATHARKKAA